MADLAKEILQARFIVRLEGDKLEPVGFVCGPTHDRCLDADGWAASGWLQDQIIPLTDGEGYIADELAAAERQVNERPFAFRSGLKLGSLAQTPERKECSLWSGYPWVLSEFNEASC